MCVGENNFTLSRSLPTRVNSDTNATQTERDDDDVLIWGWEGRGGKVTERTNDPK